MKTMCTNDGLNFNIFATKPTTYTRKNVKFVHVDKIQRPNYTFINMSILFVSMILTAEKFNVEDKNDSQIGRI